MGTPLELIKYNARNGKFEVGSSALDTLRKVKGPVAVVAVCGRARQGKSFILNQLLQSSGGFQVGATHRPCTKGLWMWSSPQRVNGPDDSTHHLVLLDTEGIDAYDQTAQYSTQIFSLAVLLSSLFVYNQMGGIDESALDRLSLVTEMTKHVRVRAAAANSTSGGEEGLGEHSPAFLWLLRDFYLQLEEEGGRKITPREYLETALRPVPGTGPAVSAKNAIRASIAQLFPARDCFTLVRPMHDEAALSQMDSLPRDKLRPEFRQGVKDLTALIFQRATPKRFGTQLMTGSVLAGLVNAYVVAINQGAVPTIATAWQGVAESECRRACDAAEAAYTAAFAAGGEVTAEESELEARHQRSLAAARAAFEEVAVGDEGIRKAHEARWMSAVASRYKDLRGRRLAEAAAAVNELLYKGANDVAQAVRGGADLSALQQRITAFVAAYEKAATGPTKWHKLAAFLVETWPAIATQVLDRQAAAAKAALEAVQREASDMRTQLSGERQRADQAERLHRDASSTAKSLQEQLGMAQQEMVRVRAALEQKSKQLSELQEDATRLRGALEQKSGTAANLQQQLTDAHRELTQLRTALEQKSGSAASLQKQLAESQRELTQVQMALEQKSSSAASLQKQLAESQRELTQVQTALEQKSGAAASLQKQLAESQRELTQVQTALEQKSSSAASLQKQLAESQRELTQVQTALEQKSGAAASLQKQLATTQQDVTQLQTALEQKSSAAGSFQQQLAEAQQDAARLRAALDQRSAKVAALEAQMSEVLLVSERKQAGAVELADARVRAAQNELQTKVAEMTAILTAERARGDSLSADLEGLAARCSSAEGRLAAQEAEASEWRNKYMREASTKLELMGQRDEARDSLQLLMVERDSVARERDAARAEAQQLRADLQAETQVKESLQNQMDGYIAEAQAARAQTVGAAGVSYGIGNDENSYPTGGTGGGRVLVEGGNIAKMTVQEIKDVLTQAGYQEDVWAMTNRKPAPKKADWIALLERRQQAAS